MAVAQCVVDAHQAVHGHPGAEGAALAGPAVTGRGGRQEGLVRRLLAHFVQDALVGGHDEGLFGAFHGGLEQLAGGTHHIGHLHHAGR